MASTNSGFKSIERFVQYLASNPHKPIFILLILMMAQKSSDLHGVGINFKTTKPRTV